MGKYPIIRTVRREVIDVGKDLFAGLNRVSHQLKNRTWHIRMADDVVWLAEYLVFCISRRP